eukprot:4874354-Prymnesium_polylepis.1
MAAALETELCAGDSACSVTYTTSRRRRLQSSVDFVVSRLLEAVAGSTIAETIAAQTAPTINTTSLATALNIAASEVTVGSFTAPQVAAVVSVAVISSVSAAIAAGTVPTVDTSSIQTALVNTIVSSGTVSASAAAALVAVVKDAVS